MTNLDREKSFDHCVSDYRIYRDCLKTWCEVSPVLGDWGGDAEGWAAHHEWLTVTAIKLSAVSRLRNRTRVAMLTDHWLPGAD